MIEKMSLTGPVYESARAVILLDVFKVQTSCGFGVPIVDEGTEGGFRNRNTLAIWGTKVVESGDMKGYQMQWNCNSLDGLTGLKAARRASGERVLWWGDFRAWVRRVGGMGDAVGVGFLGGLGVGLGLVYLVQVKGLRMGMFNMKA